MKPQHRALRITLAAVLLTLAAAASTPARLAWACSCVFPGSPAEELERASAVLAGTVTAIEQTPPDAQGFFSSADPVTVMLNVSEVWKGPLLSKLVIYTLRSGASCGYEFEVGSAHLIYADKIAGQLHISLCSRTKPLASAGEDLAALGQGNRNLATPTPTAGSSNLSTPGSAFPIAAIVASLIAVFIGVRRRKVQQP